MKIKNIFDKNGKFIIDEKELINIELRKISNNITLWREILENNIKIQTKERFNKSKTFFEFAIIKISSSRRKSFIELKLIEKNNSKKELIVLDANLTKNELKILKENSKIILLIIIGLLQKYYQNKVYPIIQENIKRLREETEKLKGKFNE